MPTGGRSYGYVSSADAGTGQREVDPEQADVVRRIFRLYADGMSPRAIADTLNRERVCSYCRGAGEWQIRPPAIRPGVGGRAYV